MNDETRNQHGGLYKDLEVIGRQMFARRRALAWVAGAGAGALVSGCGGGGSSGTTTSASTTTTSSTGTTTGPASGSAAATTTTTSGQCIADPGETNGPYPADGTNSSSGATSNVLTASGIVRADIRPSFLTGTTVAPGVQVTLTLTVVNAGASCAPLAGYAIYVWQCDRSGNYSLYTAPTESYLRGVQVTDANGQATFTTIFPGCYSGRPHIHFKVFSSLSAATSGRAAVLTSQLAMPSDVASTVYNTASITNFGRITLASDNVFGDNSAAQIAQQTPAMSGSVSAGYSATATIGITV